MAVDAAAKALNPGVELANGVPKVKGLEADIGEDCPNWNVPGCVVPLPKPRFSGWVDESLGLNRFTLGAAEEDLVSATAESVGV